MTDVLEHPEDALSALLDGELPAAEAAVVHAHVVACADCSAELDAVRVTRAAVRALPAVEPPAGFFEGLLAGGLPEDPEQPTLAPVVRLSPRRLAAANAAAALVAGIVLAVGLGGSAATAIAPQVGGAVRQHAAATTAGLGGSGLQPIGLPQASSTSIDGPYRAPQALAGYELEDAYQVEDGVQLVYRRGPYRLSVIEQEGSLDDHDLPDDGTWLDGGAWRWDSPAAGGRVLVLDRDGLVVTLVGDESPEAVLAAAEAFPGTSAGESGATRLRRAFGTALDLLSPAG